MNEKMAEIERLMAPVLDGGSGNYAVYNLEGGHEIVREGFLSEFGE